MISLNVKPFPQPRPRFVKKGNFVSTYYPKNYINWLINTKILLEKTNLPRLTGPIELNLHFFLKKPKSTNRIFPNVKPDLDNYIKSILDCLNNRLFNDDSQIIKLTAQKSYGEPQIQITWASIIS
jgi:Holliday junction resolvase RusA-like endonuclease